MTRLGLMCLLLIVIYIDLKYSHTFKDDHADIPSNK